MVLPIGPWPLRLAVRNPPVRLLRHEYKTAATDQYGKFEVKGLAPGGYTVWSNPLTCLRVAKVFNLRMDPYERADVVSDQYYDWTVKNAYLLPYGVMKSADFLQTFVDYPPSQNPPSFSIDQIEKSVNAQIKAKAGKQ